MSQDNTAVIPILPCPDIRVQTDFYKQLGFDIIEVYTAPNPYAVVALEGIELHFWGSRKNVPAENPSMCIIRVADVDALYDKLAASIKANTGKVPRVGIPRISKPRQLKADRRFTLTDMGGNTIFVITPAKEEDAFLRSIQNGAHTKDFALLYDLTYSKEDAPVAANMLPRLMAVMDELEEIDQAKLLLIEAEIMAKLNQEVSEPGALEALLDKRRDDEHWEPVRRQYGQTADD